MVAYSIQAVMRMCVGSRLKLSIVKASSGVYRVYRVVYIQKSSLQGEKSYRVVSRLESCIELSTVEKSSALLFICVVFSRGFLCQRSSVS